MLTTLLPCLCTSFYCNDLRIQSIWEFNHQLNLDMRKNAELESRTPNTVAGSDVDKDMVHENCSSDSLLPDPQSQPANVDLALEIGLVRKLDLHTIPLVMGYVCFSNSQMRSNRADNGQIS
jgi:hypothetical protein